MGIKARYSTPVLIAIFLFTWTIVNIVQAWLTPINSDEAYYWMYSRYPDWGYFDHPPMIAFMIRAGYFLFSNELGIRFFIVIGQLLSFILIWLLIDKELKKNIGNLLLFILLICSSPVINIFGFIATPDSPLLFFEVLFLFLYRKFSQKNNWKYAILMGITIAAIMYSKYHGALLIIFVILSDLKLLKNLKFYVAVLIAILLFIPHINWQYSNGFPSIKYHLIDRVSGFSFKEFPQYLLNTLIIHNPLVVPAGFFLILRGKNRDKFERTLTYIVLGIFSFFLLASFRDHIEPHWTALITIPLIIIIFNNISNYPVINKYLKKVTIISLVLILIIRVAFIIDFLPFTYLKNQYHNASRWFMEIEKIAGNRPVVFTNSYQNASRYTFFTKKFSHTLNNLNYRKNQFDLWDFEERLHGKDVLYVPHFLEGGYKEKLNKYPTSYGDTIFAREFSNFQSLQRECCKLNKEEYSFLKGDTCRIDIEIFNSYPYRLDMKDEVIPVRFQACFFQDGILMYNELLKFSKDIGFINPGESVSTTAIFTVDDMPSGNYKIAICTETGIQYITYNSKFKNAIIQE